MSPRLIVVGMFLIILSWLFAFLTVVFRKPGTWSWSARPIENPLFLLVRPRDLTPKGRIARWLCLACVLGAFLALLVVWIYEAFIRHL